METTTQPPPVSGVLPNHAPDNAEPERKYSGSKTDTVTRSHHAAMTEVEAALRRADLKLRAARARCEESIRRAPIESVLIAAAGGFVCNRLPVRSLLVTGTKIFTAFTPPTLLALGICKLADYFNRRRTRLANGDRQEALTGPDSSSSIVFTDPL